MTKFFAGLVAVVGLALIGFDMFVNAYVRTFTADASCGFGIIGVFITFLGCVLIGREQ